MSQSKIRPPLFREGQIARIVSAEELEYQIEPNHLEYGLAVAMDRTGGSAYRMLTDDPRRKLEAGEFALIATTEIVRFNYFSGATERERRDPGIEIEPIYESARNGDEVRCRIGIEFRIAAHNNENVARSLHGIMTRRGSEIVSAQDFLNERGREFGDYVHLVVQSFLHKNAANDLVSPDGFRELNKDAKDILAPRLDEVGLKYVRLVPHIYPRFGKKERIKESPDAPSVDTPMEPQPNREASSISKSATLEQEQPKDDSSQKPKIDPTPRKPMEPQPIREASSISKSAAPEKEQPKDDSSQKPKIDPTPGKPAVSPTPTRPTPAYQQENTTQRKPLTTPSASTPIKESIAATPTQAFLQKGHTASKSSVTPSISTKERPIGAKRPGAVWDANQDPSLRQPKSKRIRIGWLALWLGTGAIATIAIIATFLYIFTDTGTSPSITPPTSNTGSGDTNTDTSRTTMSTSSGGSNRIVFSSESDGDWEIYTLNLDLSSQPVQITNNNDIQDQAPVWSPDGTQIAFQSDRDGNLDIWVMNADGSNPRKLYNNDTVNDNRVIDLFPVWSPDGTQIAFQSSRDGNLDIWVMNADGSNPRKIINNMAYDLFPSWSPDGTHIAFTSGEIDSLDVPNFDLWVMNADGSNPRKITHGVTGMEHYHPSWSPDGTRFAFVSNRNGHGDIWILDEHPNTPHVNATNNSNVDDWWPVWSPDGTHIAFLSDRGSGVDVWIMGADGSNPYQVTNDGSVYGGLDWYQSTLSDTSQNTTSKRGLNATSKFQTTSTYPETDDWNFIVSNEFGSSYRVADWSDLVQYHNNGGDLIQSINNLSNLVLGEADPSVRDSYPADNPIASFYVTYRDSKNTGTGYYFASLYKNEVRGGFAVRDSISLQGHILALGSWSSLDLPVLAASSEEG